MPDPEKTLRCTDCLSFSGGNCRDRRNVDKAVTDRIAQAQALIDDGAGWVQPRFLGVHVMRSHGWLAARLLGSCGAEGRWWTPKP